MIMRLILLTILIGFNLSVSGQNTVYETLTDVKYYPEQFYTDSIKRSRCVVDVYYPKNGKGFATIIWLHGGGITGGKKEIPEYLKNKGFGVIAVGYRLSPTVKVSEAIEDSAAAIAWVLKNISQYGGDRGKVFVSGHSAGGYLGLMAILDKKYLAKHQIDANEVAELIPFSGQCITHFTVRNEQGIKETQPVIDNLSPLFHVRKDAPPILLITGDREMEMLGRYEENAYFSRMMKIVGHEQTRLLELQGYGHNMAYPAFPLLVKEIKERLNVKK